MSVPFAGGRFRSYLDSGAPNVGGQVYTRESATTIQKDAFTDSTLATPCAYVSDGVGGVYIALDARGEAQIWLGSGSYSFVEKTSAGVTIHTTDGLSDPTAGALATINTDIDTLQAAVAAMRVPLTANRTYYVRTDGSDSNTGLTNTNVGAFLTIQKAVNVIRDSLDLYGHDITISVGAGTYTGTTLLSGPWVGTGTVSIIGNITTPSSVIISTTSANCFTATNGANVTIRVVKMQTTTAGSCLAATLGGSIAFDTVEFGACANNHISTSANSTIQANAPYTISGGAQRHYFGGGVSLLTCGAGTVTLTGTPAFSVAFAGVDVGGTIECSAVTFSGSATGVRYLVDSGGGIHAGAVTLPGSSAGSITGSSGGWYI